MGEDGKIGEVSRATFFETIGGNNLEEILKKNL